MMFSGAALQITSFIVRTSGSTAISRGNASRYSTPPAPRRLGAQPTPLYGRGSAVGERWPGVRRTAAIRARHRPIAPGRQNLISLTPVFGADAPSPFDQRKVRPEAFRDRCFDGASLSHGISTRAFIIAIPTLGDLPRNSDED